VNGISKTNQISLQQPIYKMRLIK